jgi:hypothetical protein
MNIQLRKFKPEKMSDDRVCVFIGKRNTGKSTLVKDIMYYKKHIPAGVVLSGTEEGNHFYGEFIPDLFVYGDYDRDAIERVISRQRKLVGTKGKSINNGTFMLLDDCMYDSKFLKDTCIRQCFMNGRHYNIFFMLTMQYVMDLPPALRANVDYVFVLRENIIQNREKIYKSFFGIFPNFDMFNKVMDACTENYECLVLDNTSKSNKIEDCVFWYKATLRKNFRVGSPDLWKLHKKMYNPKYLDQKESDAKNATKKTRLKITKTK